MIRVRQNELDLLRFQRLVQFQEVSGGSQCVVLGRGGAQPTPSKAMFDATERRRSRTYPAWGCQTSPVLKTGWATGPCRSAPKPTWLVAE
jgi:hypothetical protein